MKFAPDHERYDYYYQVFLFRNDVSHDEDGDEFLASDVESGLNQTKERVGNPGVICDKGVGVQGSYSVEGS